MSQLSKIQQENYKFFEANLHGWLGNKLFVGKFAVIHSKELKGVFDTFQAAFKHAVDHLPQNEFIIQQIINPSEMIGYLHLAV